MARIRDILGAWHNIPAIMGIELQLRGKAWEGRYYINGERHAYKRDKLKIKIWDSPRGTDIWVHEQGGPSMSLAAWLVQHGGAADYKTAYHVINSNDTPDWERFNPTCASASDVNYVPFVEIAEYLKFDLATCPLFLWMCGLFGREAVEAAWRDYGATTDERGLAVWWYRDAEGRVCYDKRMRYKVNGKRDKTFGGTRKYRTSDGFMARPMFGSHLCGIEYPDLGLFKAADGVLGLDWGNLLPNIKNALKSKNTLIVESEKTALLCRLMFGGIWLATGGKTQLRNFDSDAVLFPDIDACDEWSSRGEVCEWWIDAENIGVEVGEHWDIGDFITTLIEKK